MNKVLLIGRLTKDPEVRYTQGENAQAVARFTLAVDRRTQDRTADFISCVAFGKTAQFAEKYLNKGIKIALEGKIQTGSYTKQDGTKVYTTDVIADTVEFCESKQVQPQGYQNYAPQGQPQGYQNNNPQFQNYPPRVNVNPQPYVQKTYVPQGQPPMNQAAQEGFMNIPDELNDEGLPFG